MKYMKFITKRKSYNKIYYGAVKHEDTSSYTIIGCEDDCKYIELTTLAKQEYEAHTIEKDLLRQFFDKCMIYRDRKLDDAKFNLDDEQSKFGVSEARYSQALGKI